MSLNLEPVRDIFAAMTKEQLHGIPFSEIIGGGDPLSIASEVATAIISHARPTRRDSILDVGCGCGRIAAAFTQYLNQDGCYVGVDIVPALVEFAQRWITARYPRFRFLTIDQGNRSYDWLRGNRPVDINTLAAAGPAASFDLAVAVSLFTHLDLGPAIEMLTSIRPLLKEGGRAFVTVFVLDDDSRESIEQGKSDFSFKHRTPGGELYSEKPKESDPTFAVAYDDPHLRQLISSSGFRLEQRVPGYWSTRGGKGIYQDALILTK